VLVDQVAAISVGVVAGELCLDLCYVEDSKARIDANVIATPQGDVVEVQATVEERALPRPLFDQLVDLGLLGVARLGALQREVLLAEGVSLDDLLVPPPGDGARP
jgi:ribonuclease PH